MDNEKIIEHIAEIEREIAVLPAGGVSKKNVHGNIYYYHRITQNGKRIEKYVKADEVDELISNIEKRKKLEKELKKLKQCMPKGKNLDFKTKVLVGDRLKSLVSITRNYKKRECIQMLRDYIFKDIADKVFILYGLRRTGKTTLIRQIILELSESDFNKAAFFQITSKDSLSDIDEDLSEGVSDLYAMDGVSEEDTAVDTKPLHEDDVNPEKTKEEEKETQPEKYVEEAFTQIKMGKDGDSVYHPLYKAWRAMQADPACIKKIHNKREAGNGLLVFLSYGTIRDIDDRQQIISLSYLMLSEEIEINPNSLNTIKNRILSMTIDREAFQYTVSAAIGTNAAFDFMGFSQFESRDAALKMLYKDLTLSPVFKNLPDFAEMLNDLEMKISNDFFGGHETPDSIKAQGETNHSKVLSYLREKVYEEECLDF